MRQLHVCATRAPSLVLLAVLGCGGDSATTEPEPTPPANTTVDVFTPGNTFSPFSITVAVGGTVRFNISGVAHNAVFDRRTAGAPADINVVTNTVVSRVFNTKGTFAYDCTVHPGMSGEVVVK